MAPRYLTWGNFNQPNQRAQEEFLVWSLGPDATSILMDLKYLPLG